MDSTDYFDQFIVLAAVGFGLLLVGGTNLALGARSGRRFALRAGINIAICALVAVGVSEIARGELAARAAMLLGGLVLTITLSNSEWLQQRLVLLVSLLLRPSARWGLLTVGGLALVLGSVVAFEHADSETLELQTRELEAVLGPPPNTPTERARATTDRGSRVVLKEPLNPRDCSDLAEPEEKLLRERKLTTQIIRNSAPTDTSNCHGWVFTGGQFLLSPDDVELILKENGYAETNDPRPGDVAIYRQNGGISHSALVRYASEGQPVMVEGKWGTLGVYLHGVDKSLYGTDYTFYRSPRPGHLLAGLSGTNTNSVNANPSNVIPAASSD